MLEASGGDQSCPARPHSNRMAVPHLNFSWCQISVCASLADSYTNLARGKAGHLSPAGAWCWLQVIPHAHDAARPHTNCRWAMTFQATPCPPGGRGKAREACHIGLPAGGAEEADAGVLAGAGRAAVQVGAGGGHGLVPVRCGEGTAEAGWRHKGKQYSYTQAGRTDVSTTVGLQSRCTRPRALARPSPSSHLSGR